MLSVHETLYSKRVESVMLCFSKLSIRLHYEIHFSTDGQCRINNVLGLAQTLCWDRYRLKDVKDEDREAWY